MKRNILGIASILTVCFLSSCMTKEQHSWAEFCNNTIWKSHGYYDATNGLNYKIMAVYKKRCGDFFSDADSLEYQKGYIKGAKVFCTYENGYKMGLANNSHPKSCPFELAKSFNSGFKAGRAAYHLQENTIQTTREYQERTNAEEKAKASRGNGNF